MEYQVDVAALRHEDKCRHHDDPGLCDCGAVEAEKLRQCEARLASVEQERDLLKDSEEAMAKWVKTVEKERDDLRAEMQAKDEQDTHLRQLLMEENDDLRAQLEREKGERAADAERQKELFIAHSNEMGELGYKNMKAAEQAVGALTEQLAAALEDVERLKIIRNPCWAFDSDELVMLNIFEREGWYQNTIDTLRAQLAAAQLHAEGQYRAGMEAAKKVDELQKYLEQLAMESKLAVADNAYTRAAYEAELCAQAIRALPAQQESVCECGWQKVADRDWYQIAGKGALWPGPMTECPYCGRPIRLGGGA